MVKVGGHALDSLAPDGPVLVDLAHDVMALRGTGVDVVLVHGGGPQIADLLGRLGLASTFHEGLRVTDAETMEVVAMALSLVNLQIVAALGHAGLDAVGLSGADGGLLTSVGVGEPWIRVGASPTVRPDVIESLWSRGETPVVCPIALDASGQMLNVNADVAAGALAAALGADALILLSDVDQVRLDPDDPATAVARLARDAARELVDSGGARDGMRPKLVAALDALEGGASAVTLANGTRPHALASAVDGSAAVTEVSA